MATETVPEKLNGQSGNPPLSETENTQIILYPTSGKDSRQLLVQIEHQNYLTAADDAVRLAQQTLKTVKSDSTSSDLRLEGQIEVISAACNRLHSSTEAQLRRYENSDQEKADEKTNSEKEVILDALDILLEAGLVDLKLKKSEAAHQKNIQAIRIGINEICSTAMHLMQDDPYFVLEMMDRFGEKIIPEEPDGIKGRECYSDKVLTMGFVSSVSRLLMATRDNRFISRHPGIVPRLRTSLFGHLVDSGYSWQSKWPIQEKIDGLGGKIGIFLLEDMLADELRYSAQLNPNIAADQMIYYQESVIRNLPWSQPDDWLGYGYTRSGAWLLNYLTDLETWSRNQSGKYLKVFEGLCHVFGNPRFVNEEDLDDEVGLSLAHGYEQNLSQRSFRKAVKMMAIISGDISRLRSIDTERSDISEEVKGGHIEKLARVFDYCYAMGMKYVSTEGRILAQPLKDRFLYLFEGIIGTEHLPPSSLGAPQLLSRLEEPFPISSLDPEFREMITSAAWQETNIFLGNAERYWDRYSQDIEMLCVTGGCLPDALVYLRQCLVMADYARTAAVQIPNRTGFNILESERDTRTVNEINRWLEMLEQLEEDWRFHPRPLLERVKSRILSRGYYFKKRGLNLCS